MHAGRSHALLEVWGMPRQWVGVPICRTYWRGTFRSTPHAVQYRSAPQKHSMLPVRLGV